MMVRPPMPKKAQFANASRIAHTPNTQGASPAKPSPPYIPADVPPGAPANDTRLLGELLKQLLSQRSGLLHTDALEYGEDYNVDSIQPIDAPSSDDLLQIELDGTIYKLTVTTWSQPTLTEPPSAKDHAQDLHDFHILSPREREIVRLVARGLPNKTIATVLEISSWTVATHLRRVFAKLEVTTRAAMVARAAEAGLLA